MSKDVQMQAMLELPKPKFALGQTVYWGSYRSEEESIPCPDCNGEGVWHVTTPSGLAFDVPCGRCSKTLARSRPSVFIPVIRSGVISEWKVRSIKGQDKPCVSYAVDGHGRHEQELHATVEEAQTDAEAKAAKANSDRSDKYENDRRRALWREDLANALAAELKHDHEEIKLKYNVVVHLIHDLPNQYFSGIDDEELITVGKHLLDMLNEEYPSEWGCEE